MQSAFAQSSLRTMKLEGRVYDAFTEMYLPGTKVTLMNSDSAVVDTTQVFISKNNGVFKNTLFSFTIPAVKSNYIVKFEHENYKPIYIDCDVKQVSRRKSYWLPDAKMTLVRKNGGLYGENELDEVTVKATKVQFYYKGDTIVYNADAFNLPEGSMLDALIKQMPGAEIKENGEIFINGRKIDYLTLNGKKMFNGKGQVLLQNLPHYSVKDLKVFEKNQENMIGTDRGSIVKDYVMDVSLKRQYNQRNFGNVELGIGTKNRWLGRLFDIYNKESLMVMGFANLNNVNQTREPGEDGTFADSDAPRSVVKNRQFGLSANREKNQGNFANLFEVTGQIKGTDLEYQQLQETYLGRNNIFKNTSEYKNDKISSFGATNQVIFRKPFFIYFETNAHYNDGKNWLQNMIETSDKEDGKDGFVNKSDFWRQNKAYSYDLGQKFWLYKPTGWGDEMQLKAGISYKNGKNRSNEEQRIVYPRINVDSLYEYMANENVRTRGYTLNAEAFYKFNFLNGMGLELNYSYTQDNERKNRVRYKNDVTDNSYHSNSTRRESLPGVVLSYKDKKLTVVSGLRLKVIDDRMSYLRDDLDTLFHRNYIDVFPDLRIKWNSGKSRINFYTKFNSYDKPAVLDLIERVDDTNPIVKTMGNGELKKASMYDYQFTYYYRGGKRDFNLMFTSQSQFSFNSIIRGMLYDEETGSYLITPCNVNGVWHSYNAVRVGWALNKKKSWKIQNFSIYDFFKSIEMLGTIQTGFQRSAANRQWIEDQLVLSYQYKKMTLRLLGSVKYQGSYCKDKANANYDAWDTHYGFNLNCYLPWNIQLAGDMGMYSRRGYSLEALNKDNLLANVSLSRSFFKSRLVIKAKAFDLFHKLTSIERNLASTYVEETSYNCIPRYLMLSATYRFGKK